jgi:D-2-hydroxyacid dehydrogenase (NADP+)
VMSTDALDAILPVVDHVVLLLPANRTTDGLFDANRLRRCKPGAFIYNFGRGNVLASDDLMAAMDHLGGAFLDVVDEEPLPPASPLWTTPNIMITPHSSCIYQDYKQSFIAEVAEYFDRI